MPDGISEPGGTHTIRVLWRYSYVLRDDDPMSPTPAIWKGTTRGLEHGPGYPFKHCGVRSNCFVDPPRDLSLAVM